MKFVPLSATAGVLLVAWAAAGADKPKSALDALQGKWKMTAAETGGKPLPPEFVRDRETVIVVAGDKWTETVKGGAKPLKAVVKLDAAKTPTPIDLTEAAPDPGQPPDVLLGVVEVKGDTLRLCIARQGSERPKEFKTADRNTLYREFARVTP